jgi:hypothetical protein
MGSNPYRNGYGLIAYLNYTIMGISGSLRPIALQEGSIRGTEVRAMMTLSDAAGYVASTMVLLTFLTKDMRLLRLLAIVSNIAFVTYGLLVWLPPVFCLHLLLLPINTVRLREILTTSSSPLSATRPLNGRPRSAVASISARLNRAPTRAWWSLHAMRSSSA